MLRFLAILLYATHAFAAQPLADVPLIGDNHRARILVDINGHRGVECLFDTGSTTGVIGRDIANGAERTGVRRFITANTTISVPLVLVRDVAIGGAHVHDVEFVQRDASWFGNGGTMPCIIGLSLASKFTVDLDGHARRLRLFAPGTDVTSVLDPTQRAGSEVNVAFPGDGISTDILVNGIKVHSHIDTGWGDVTPNQALLDRLGYTHDDPRFIVKKIQHTDSGRIDELRKVTLSSVQLGNVKMLDVLGDADLDHDYFAIVRRQPGLYMQIGWPVLSDHRFIFDMRTRRAAFVP